jgi:hypothetical protein
MGLPDFLIVGAPKAGSTALHAALEQHPRLRLTSPKETKHFLTGGRPPSRATQRGPGDAHSAKEWIWQRERYEALFDRGADGVLAGESTPFYLWDRDAHARIAATIPEVKLIAVIRDPVDRAYSNWTHLWCDGLETEPDFLTACAAEDARAAAGYAPFWRYVGLGRYGEQLDSLYKHFPREHVHVLRYRDLVDAPAETLDRITEFLHIEPGLIDHVPPSNVSSWAGQSRVNTALRRSIRGGAALGAYADPRIWRQVQRPLIAALHRGDAHRPTLSVEARRSVVPAFAEDVARLESLTGASFQDWLSDTGRGTYSVRKSLAPSPRVASQ